MKKIECPADIWIKRTIIKLGCAVNSSVSQRPHRPEMAGGHLRGHQVSPGIRLQRGSKCRAGTHTLAITSLQRRLIDFL